MNTARGDNLNTDAPATVPPPPDVVLTVSCGHSETTRKVTGLLAPMMNTLQVVPNHNPTTVATSLTLFGVVQFQAQASGNGDDTIVAFLEDRSGAMMRNPQLAITQASSPADSDWQNGTVLRKTIPTPGDNSVVWLGGAQPTVWNVFGRGDIGADILQAKVEAFPCYSIQGTASIQEAANVVKEINDKLNFVLKPIVDAAGAAANGKAELTLIPPKGTVQLTSGWQENSDARAYYGWEAKVGLDPIVGAAVKVSVDLLSLAATTFAVPPLLTKYVGGIFLGLELGGQMGISGRAARTGPGGMPEAGVSGNGQISAELSLAAKAGNDAVLSGQLVGASKTSITLTVNVSASDTGLLMNPSLTWNGLVVSVSVVTTAYKVELTNSQLCVWTVIDPWSPPWQPSSPWVLLR